MQIAVGDGVEGARLGQLDLCLQDRLGEDIWAVGTELRPSKFDWQLGTIGNVVERNPGDVMLDCVGVGDLFADSNLYFVEIAGSRGHRTRYRGEWGDGNHRDMLFGFPVGGFDERREHFS